MTILVSALVSRAARLAGALGLVAALTACAPRDAVEVTRDPPGTVAGYGILEDEEYTLPAVPAEFLEEPNRKAEVAYAGGESPGTIVVDPHAKFLYLVGEAGTATRYPIAVGREGRGFRRSAYVAEVRRWPGWTPTANMLRREPEVYGPFRRGVPGGLASPLGARALYLHRGGRDTFYRIHGTNDLTSIGNSGSAGCIRLFNQDVIDLAERVAPGATVRVRSEEESMLLEPEHFGRGVELPPLIVPAEDIYNAVAAEQAERAAAGGA